MPPVTAARLLMSARFRLAVPARAAAGGGNGRHHGPHLVVFERTSTELPNVTGAAARFREASEAELLHQACAAARFREASEAASVRFSTRSSPRPRFRKPPPESGRPRRWRSCGRNLISRAEEAPLRLADARVAKGLPPCLLRVAD